jgi:hypothetical protein
LFVGGISAISNARIKTCMAEKRDKNKDKSKKSDKGKEVAAKAVPSKEIPKVVEAVKAEVPSPVTP